MISKRVCSACLHSSYTCDSDRRVLLVHEEGNHQRARYDNESIAAQRQVAQGTATNSLAKTHVGTSFRVLLEVLNIANKGHYLVVNHQNYCQILNS